MIKQFARKIKNKVAPDSSLYKQSYSQMAEDVIASNYLYHDNGFYVDIGAYHPKQFSNTYYFYKKNWSGINVDGSAEAIRTLKEHRSRDTNIHTLIGSNAEPVVFYEFAQRTLNTTVKEALPDIKKYHNEEPISTHTINCMTLEALLDKYLPAGKQIDLMNIDTEGADEMILRSNNWDKYKPKLIIVEKHASLNDFLASSLHAFLLEKEYTVNGYCKHAFILLHNSYWA